MITKYIKGAINITIIPILATILLLGIYKTSTDPKTGIMIITISTIIISIILAYSYLSKSKIKYNIGQFIAITLNIILIFSIYNINKDYKYIENTFSNNYNYLKNNVYVLKSTKYKSSNQLSNKKIGILKNNSNNTTPIITPDTYDSVKNAQNKKKDSSVIGSAVVGSIIAGPVGGVVGAIHAADKNNRNKRS